MAIQLDEHAGFDTTLPDSGDPPPGYPTAHFEYEVPYDRFTPYNAP